MQKQAPTFGRLATMIVFALSCFGLLLFLWLAFGGPIPLKPKGYRVFVAVPEANQLAIEAEVRVSGVTIGKIREKERLPRGNKTLVGMELDRAAAPLDADARVVMRSKTLLGEKYLELTRGSPGGPKLAEGDRLPDASVEETVELDEVLSILDPTTRRLFRTWQREQGGAIRDRGRDLSDALGTLPRFAASGTDLLTVLDGQAEDIRRLFRNTGRVFEAVGRDEGQLTRLITSADEVFSTTARKQRALQETFAVFPTFLDESRLTAQDLESFARQARPVISDLRPAIRDLVPTLRDARALAPDLERFAERLGPLIDVSKQGLPALRDTLNGLDPVLRELQPFLEQVNPILEWLEMHQRTTADFFSNGGGALVDTVSPNRTPQERGHYLGQYGLTGPETVVIQPGRSREARGNAYLTPSMLEGKEKNERMIYPSWDCENTPEGVHTTQKRDSDDEPSCWVKQIPGSPTRFPHIGAADYAK